jgi:hypothetical protein
MSSPKPFDNSLESAHCHCSNNRKELLASEKCGCFHCLSVFLPSDVLERMDDDTTLCPHCSVDSVIGSSSGFDPTPEFLTQMCAYWFG